jgi:hypothetical protein
MSSVHTRAMRPRRKCAFCARQQQAARFRFLCFVAAFDNFGRATAHKVAKPPRGSQDNR